MILTGCLFLPDSPEWTATIVSRQEHPRFLDLTPRISKNGTKATDLLVVRVHSYYAYISPDEEVGFGLLCSVQCSHPHLNFPQLFMVLLNLAANAPTIDNHGGLLADLLLFPGMWTGSKGSRVIFMRPKSEAEINSCLTQDLRMYVFRRGGAQNLKDQSGKYPALNIALLHTR